MGWLACLNTSVALIVEPPRQPHFAPRTSSFFHCHRAEFVLHNQSVEMIRQRYLKEPYVRPRAIAQVTKFLFPFLLSLSYFRPCFIVQELDIMVWS